MTSLKNKIVLITGASSGIGKACAEKFAELGASLILIARRKEKLQIVEKELQKKYSIKIYTVQLDVTKRNEVKKFFDTLPKEWKNISILINNAGLSRGLDEFQNANIDDWEEMIDTNIKGLLYVTRTLLPTMIKNNEGHIINIGSTAGHFVYPKGNVYNATKFAVNALTQALKMDLHGTPIRVTSIDPGLVETEFSIVRFHGDTEKAKKVYEGMTPLSPNDVADAVIWSATRPPHVNIQDIILMPTDQSSPTMVHRRK